MAFVHTLTLHPRVAGSRRTPTATSRRPTLRAAWRASAATGASIDADANANGKTTPDAEADSPRAESGAEREWRSHIVNAADVDESSPMEVPVELAEGYLPDGGTRPKLDVDADEVMLMWKMRRMLHKDDYKRIFQNPRVGEL